MNKIKHMLKLLINVSDLYNKYSKNNIVMLIISICMIIISALLQTYVMQVFMEPCHLIAGGFTGMALLLSKIFDLFKIDFSVSMGIILLNIPAILFCYRYLSKQFAWLSCLQFVFVSIFAETFQFISFFDDKILNVLFGGFLWGLAISLALKAGGSTGGTDLIAQFISNKIHKGIWQYVFFFNCVLFLIFGSIFGWVYAGYTIIFQLISTKMISIFYQQYTQITVEIATCHPNRVTRVFMDVCHHGMSVLQGYGGYSYQNIYVCKSVISSYEEKTVIQAIKRIDPEAIIYTYRTENFYGRFYRKPVL